MKKIRNLTVLAVIAAVIGIAIGISTCDNSVPNPVPPPPPTVATPTADPAAGTYATAQTVTLACTTEGASIYYTSENKTPTTADTLYSSPITISTTTTISAIALKAEMANSKVLKARYVIETPPNTVVTPTANPPAGTYTTEQTVTLSTSTEGATIYYTLDGETPTIDDAEEYTTPLFIEETTTIKAIAVKDGMNNSGILTAVYTMNIATPSATLITEQSKVSIVRSTEAQASSITQTQILEMVREAITQAGGIDDIVTTGSNVVLKPNLICTSWNWGTSTTTDMSQTVNGVTTDWRVVHAVATIVREKVGAYNNDANDPKGRILIMEGPGKSSTSGSAVHHLTNMGYTTTNFDSALVQSIISLETEGTTWTSGKATTGTETTTATDTQVTLPAFFYTGADSASNGMGAAAYNTYYQNNGKYWVNNKMLQADALISIPVVKSHWDAGTTGAIKNIGIGATPPKIYGISNNDVGRNNMVNHNASDNFHSWIADYFSALPADFVVMDGLQGLDNGPLPGVNSNANLVGYQQNLRCILASKDALAIDIVETNIIGWDYTTIPYITKLAGRGYVWARGETGNSTPRTIPLRGDPKNIVVLGNVKLDDANVRDGKNLGTSQADGGHGYRKGGTNAQFYIKKIKESNAQNATVPTITINSAEFSGSTLTLNLALSIGAHDGAVKVDVYIDDAYKGSYDPRSNAAVIVSVDATDIAAGSHSIEVRAFNKYMYNAVATETATK